MAVSQQHALDRINNVNKLTKTIWTSFDDDNREWKTLPVDNILREFKRQFQRGETPLANALAWSDLAPALPQGSRALVTEHEDKPGEIASIASTLAGWRINIAGAAVLRNEPAGRAVLITLVDARIPIGLLRDLRASGYHPDVWNWKESEVIDLTSFPVGWNHQGIAVAAPVPDVPGEIAKVARFLAELNLNCTGFLVFRPLAPNGAGTGGMTLQVNLLDEAPKLGVEFLKDEFRQAFRMRRPGGDLFDAPDIEVVSLESVMA